MTASTLSALLITLQCASLATLVVIVPGTIVAYVLARYRFVGKSVVSAIVTLPLVLPPTAVGYVLLRTFGQRGMLGVDRLGIDFDILLTKKGVVLACAVMAMPLVVRTARVTFEGIDPRLESMARTLGYGRITTFFRFTVPLAWRGLLAALILGFTRAVGEFGATVTIAGNIPGRTQTLASAIFSAQQVGDDRQAYVLLVVALLVGSAAILASEYLARRRSERSASV